MSLLTITRQERPDKHELSLLKYLFVEWGEKAVAHHPDYDRPLDVVWLCQPHHKQTHALVANEPSITKAA